MIMKLVDMKLTEEMEKKLPKVSLKIWMILILLQKEIKRNKRKKKGGGQMVNLLDRLLNKNFKFYYYFMFFQSMKFIVQKESFLFCFAYYKVLSIQYKQY